MKNRRSKKEEVENDDVMVLCVDLAQFHHEKIVAGNVNYSWLKGTK